MLLTELSSTVLEISVNESVSVLWIELSSTALEISVNESVSVPDSVDNSETADYNIRASHQNQPCVEESGSSVKLIQGNPDFLFDKDVSLTGFRLVDIELLVQFVQQQQQQNCRVLNISDYLVKTKDFHVLLNTRLTKLRRLCSIVSANTV